MDRGDWTSAAEAFLRAQDVFTALMQQDSSQLDWLIGLADSHSWLSSAYLEAGNLTGSKRQREEELRIYHALLADNPDNRAASYELAPAHMHMARLLLITGEAEAALEEYDQALHFAEQRLRNDPENSVSAQLAGSAHLDHARAFLADGQVHKAKLALVEAETITKQLLKKDQSILKWQVELRCQGLVIRSQMNLLSGDFDEGLRYSSKAIDELTRLSPIHPENQGITLLLANAHLISGRLLQAAERPDKAQAAWKKVAGLLTPIGRKLKPNARADLAWANFHLGKTRQARDLVKTLDDIGYRHPHFIDLKTRLNLRGKT